MPTLRSNSESALLPLHATLREGCFPIQERRTGTEQECGVSSILRGSESRRGNGEFPQASSPLLILVSPVLSSKLPRDAVWAVGNLPWRGEERDRQGLLTAALRRLVLICSSANGRQKQENRPVFPWFSSLFPI